MTMAGNTVHQWPEFDTQVKTNIKIIVLLYWQSCQYYDNHLKMEVEKTPETPCVSNIHKQWPELFSYYDIYACPEHKEDSKRKT
jgi:hypothetical protein